jgi:membrane protease YdiL (CAAX protease family)/Pyruvate/2-oxoacid:ferredoxin oxidoreductase delta subunit
MSAENTRPPSTKSTHLTLQPERCTGCGECLKVCVPAAIRLSNAAVHVDWRVCTNCCECAAVCTPRAIQRAIVPLRSASGAGVAAADVPRVVVGSRAEAKALRKAAEKTAKRTPGKAASPDRAVSPAGRGVFRKRDVAAAAGGAMGAVGSAAGLVSAVGGAGEAAMDVGGFRESESEAATVTGPVLGTVNWSLADTGLVMAVGLLAIVGKNAVMSIPAIGLMPTAGRSMTHAGILALYYAAQLAALSILAARHGSSVAVAFGLRRAPDTESRPTESRPAETRRAAERPSALASAGIVIGLLVGVEAIAIGYGLTMATMGWAQPGTVSGDVAAIFGNGGAGLVLAGLMVALVAPIVEELAFRGVALVALAPRLGVWPAIAIQAVLFAAYHASAWLFFPMLVFGAALGWLAWSRRSLWPAIVLHVLYNGLAVAAAFLVPS